VIFSGGRDRGGRRTASLGGVEKTRGICRRITLVVKVGGLARCMRGKGGEVGWIKLTAERSCQTRGGGLSSSGKGDFV